MMTAQYRRTEKGWQGYIVNESLRCTTYCQNVWRDKHDAILDANGLLNAQERATDNAYGSIYLVAKRELAA